MSAPVYFLLSPIHGSIPDRFLFKGQRVDHDYTVLEPEEYQGKKFGASRVIIFRNLTNPQTGPLDDITYEVFLNHYVPEFRKRARIVTPVHSFNQFQKIMNMSLNNIFKPTLGFDAEDSKYWHMNLVEAKKWLQKPKDFSYIPLQKYIHAKKLFGKIFPDQSEDVRIAQLSNQLQNPV